MKVLNSKKLILIMLLITIVFYIAYASLGTLAVGYNYYDEYSRTLYRCDGDIFVPIVFLILLILVIFTLMFYFDGLKFVRFHKFMSFVDFMGVFGVSLAQGILLLDFCNHLTTIGYIVNTFIILTCVVSFASGIICLINLFSMPAYESPKTVERRENLQRENAVQKLKDLKELYDSGVISFDEYNEKKQKYIDML